MYLISLYFDEQTTNRINALMQKVAKQTGNEYMLTMCIPPHITVASVECECNQEEDLILGVSDIVSEMKKGSITWVSVGTFQPNVMYIMPVLNEYLHQISTLLNSHLKTVNQPDKANLYEPFHWIPHTTIARKLTEQQMLTAFKVLQHNFSVFSGEVVKIGLSKSKPYREIKSWEL